MSVAIQIIFFLFLRNEKEYWFVYTFSLEGGMFSWAFGFASELLFWIGYAVFIIGFCMAIYKIIIENNSNKTLEINSISNKIKGPRG